MQSAWQFSRTLWFKDKDLWSEDKDNDKWSEDLKSKDKNL